MNKKDKKLLPIVLIVVLLPLAILFGVLAIDLMETPEYVVENQVLYVKSFLYSKEISLENVDISLESGTIPYLKRVVGTGTKKLAKGKFTLRGVDGYVYSNIVNYGGDYIKINGETVCFLNLKSNEETVKLYEYIVNNAK